MFVCPHDALGLTVQGLCPPTPVHPIDIRHGTPQPCPSLLVTSGVHHGRPVQTFSLEGLDRYWHLVATEACTVGKCMAIICPYVQVASYTLLIFTGKCRSQIHFPAPSVWAVKLSLPFLVSDQRSMNCLSYCMSHHHFTTIASMFLRLSHSVVVHFTEKYLTIHSGDESSGKIQVRAVSLVMG